MPNLRYLERGGRREGRREVGRGGKEKRGEEGRKKREEEEGKKGEEEEGERERRGGRERDRRGEKKNGRGREEGEMGRSRRRRKGERRGGRRAHLRVFCTSILATTAMVVGREAAHTPSCFNVFSSYQMPPHWGHTEERGGGGNMSCTCAT